ncbi:hypothetical protein V5O48_008814 [Marasmius crinis-equi]|uniref:Uncharacterized protein n=1 Tax=Marasmius crinis-equi TaxID=585013 RepID=A0ABR3FD33_9AGAR
MPQRQLGIARSGCKSFHHHHHHQLTVATYQSWRISSVSFKIRPRVCSRTYLWLVAGKDCEEAREQVLEFGRIVWKRWSAVWLKEKPVEQTGELKKLMQDILWESKLHRRYIHIGAKPDVESIPWNEALDLAITTSGFELWADLDYIQGQVPQAPSPRAPSCTPSYEGLSAEDAVKQYEKELDKYRKQHFPPFEGEKEEDEDGDWMF